MNQANVKNHYFVKMARRSLLLGIYHLCDFVILTTN